MGLYVSVGLNAFNCSGVLQLNLFYVHKSDAYINRQEEKYDAGKTKQRVAVCYRGCETLQEIWKLWLFVIVLTVDFAWVGMGSSTHPDVCHGSVLIDSIDGQIPL